MESNDLLAIDEVARFLDDEALEDSVRLATEPHHGSQAPRSASPAQAPAGPAALAAPMAPVSLATAPLPPIYRSIAYQRGANTKGETGDADTRNVR